MAKKFTEIKIWRFTLNLLVLSLVFGGVMVVFGFLIKSQAQVIGKQQAELTALQKKEKNLRELQKEYQKIEEEAQKILTILPTPDNFLQFVNYLEEKASENGVAIALEFPEKTTSQKQTPASTTNVSAGTAGQSSKSQTTSTSKTSSPQPQTVNFTVTVTGPYTGLLGFWKTLEGGPYFVTLTKVNLQLPGSFDLDGELKLEGELYVDQSFPTTA